MAIADLDAAGRHPGDGPGRVFRCCGSACWAARVADARRVTRQRPAPARAGSSMTELTSVRVFSAAGRASTSDAVPVSSGRPSRHHRDVVGDLADDRQVVADEHDRQPGRRELASRSSTCAWTVTSSAVVGSSQSSTSARPRARPRSSPAGACRRRAGAGSRARGAPARGSRPARAARAPVSASARRGRPPTRRDLGDLGAHRETGSSAAASWKTRLTRAPRTARACQAASGSRCRLTLPATVADRQRAPAAAAHRRAQCQALAAARLADDAEGRPARDREGRSPSTARAPIPGTRSSSARSSTCARRGHRRTQPESASPSPISEKRDR